MPTFHALAQHLWEILPELATGLRFGAAVLSFGLSASSAWTQLERARARRRGDRSPR
jgi:hypothetical protein